MYRAVVGIQCTNLKVGRGGSSPSSPPPPPLNTADLGYQYIAHCNMLLMLVIL